MTLSFHKVMFDAQEVLDMAADAETLLDFQLKFCDTAEERSRTGPRRPAVTEAGLIDRDGTLRAECMGTTPHSEHQFNGGMWCPGLAAWMEEE